MKKPWCILETVLNHPQNTPWNSLEVLLKHWRNNTFENPWNTLETLYKYSWNTLETETPLEPFWNTPGTPFKHLYKNCWTLLNKKIISNNHTLQAHPFSGQRLFWSLKISVDQKYFWSSKFFTTLQLKYIMRPYYTYFKSLPKLETFEAVVLFFFSSISLVQGSRMYDS